MEDTPGLFINGAIMIAIFSPLVVLVHGRMKGPDEPKELNLRLAMPWKEWILKLLSIAVLYMIIYILFGMLVFQPLAGEAFQEYYAGLELPAIDRSRLACGGLYPIKISVYKMYSISRNFFDVFYILFIQFSW